MPLSASTAEYIAQSGWEKAVATRRRWSPDICVGGFAATSRQRVWRVLRRLSAREGAAPAVRPRVHHDRERILEHVERRRPEEAAEVMGVHLVWLREHNGLRSSVRVAAPVRVAVLEDVCDN